MNRSGGMGQLAKGMVIGIVLLLAIIGTMSIFDQTNNTNEIFSTTDSKQYTQTQKKPDTPAPSINITNPNVKTPETITPNTETPNAQTEQEKSSEENQTDTTNLENPPNKPNTEDLQKEQAEEEEVATEKNEFKPTLENERILKEKPLEKPKYGLLKLTALNPNNNKKVLASFVVLDMKGKRVASTKSAKETSFRLPIGKYKIITTLKKSGNSERSSKPIKSTKIIRVTTNKKISRIFKLTPAPTLGVLQVSAKNANTGKTIKANYIIQKKSGKVVATRNNVTHTLFKLKSGSYKVTVKKGNNSDFRTIVVEPGGSSKEVFRLQEALKRGKVFVKVSDTRSNKPVKVDIIITTLNGTTVQMLKAVSQTEISLPAGKYKIRVTGPSGQSSKKITVTGGKTINEKFRFDVPKNNTANTVQITDNVKITAPRENVKPAVKPAPEVKPLPAIKGSIKLYARNSTNNIPLKSNFYVQLPNGKNIAKKVYTNSAQFSLTPGVYRITVRSKNRKNIVRTIRVLSGKSSSEVFSLVSTLPKPIAKPIVKPSPKPEPTSKPIKPPPNAVRQITQAPPARIRQPVLAPQKPAKVATESTTRATKPEPPKTKTVPNGFLRVAMSPPNKTHFIVSTRSGKRIVELTSVPSATFKLDTGEYKVTAIRNQKRRTKTVRVHSNKTIRIKFNGANFQKPKPRRNTAISKGVLRSRIVNRNGQQLRGNLTVTNSRGQVIARAVSVTVGVFDLPPGPHTVILNYNGLQGSERVNIRSRETTMQTFTVAPN